MSETENRDRKRKVLSLKSGADTKRNQNLSGARTVEVEVKRQRSGLSLKVNKGNAENKWRDNSGKRFEPNRKLTDREYRARLKALNDARREEDKRRREREAQRQEATKTEEKVHEAVVAQEQQQEPERKFERRKRQNEQRRHEQYVPNSQPVVFKAKEYRKDEPKQRRDDNRRKRDEKPKSQIQPKQLERDVPDIPVKEKQANTHSKQRERMFDDSDSPKKMKIVVKTRNADRRAQNNSGKMSWAMIDRAMDDGTDERSRSMASVKRARNKMKSTGQRQEAPKVVREVEIPETITVGELANRMAVRSAEVVKYLMSIGTMTTINQSIDGDTAEVICTEFGHKPKRRYEDDIENELLNIVDAPEDLSPRAPIVAVMGHVDHGKTTLLDTLRRTSVAQREAGGITQHVAAYQISTEDGRKITFIDTPGHAAFTKIRERGAVITDIIVLVVAADDGIKEQTIEVIQQAKSQNVPIVVAINKIDKPNINIEKVKSELMTQGVILESFGGETLSAEISAKQNVNLNGLLEAILLQAEILELKANEKRAPVGTILEARIDKGKGIVASVIVQHGTLQKGDVYVAGKVSGKVRTIYDDTGKVVPFAKPSTPVTVAGFDSAPEPGDVLAVVETEQRAREIAEYRRNAQKVKSKKSALKSIDQMLASDETAVQTLNVLAKADVYGSLEAVVASLEAIQHPEITVKVVEKGVGMITEGDVDFAKTSDAVIVGFNVNATTTAKELTKRYGVRVLNHNVIYHMTEEIKNIIGTMLSPIIEENYIGTADVRKIFTISRLGTIAGCYVTDGVIKRADSQIKVLRGNKCIFEGKIKSMKHEKDEIKESRKSHECGILAEDYNDFQEGDKIECYEIVYKSRSVD